jgi:hypothetical protein
MLCVMMSQRPWAMNNLFNIGNLFNNGAMTTSYVATRAEYIQYVGAITEVAELGSCNISMSGKTWQIEGRNDVALLRGSLGSHDTNKACHAEFMSSTGKSLARFQKWDNL